MKAALDRALLLGVRDGTPNMYDASLPASEATSEALARFASARADALLSAAELLGGPKARRRTGRLIQDLEDAPRLTRRLRKELVALHRLLSLQDVEDPDREEAAFFAMIDPASPAVEEICLLTDELTALLEALVGIEDQLSVPFGRAA